MGFYARWILPALLDAACCAPAIERQRGRLVPLARGVVLELGFGSGRNLRHYDPEQIERVIGLEPAAGMLARARKPIAAAAFPVEIRPEPAENALVEAASVDTVLVTYSLCTIDDPVAALSAARRALKPGGRLLFCEHGLAPDEAVRRTQHRLGPLWRAIGGGCRLDRDIPAIIAAAGFQVTDLSTRYLPRTPRWAGFNYRGAALAV